MVKKKLPKKTRWFKGEEYKRSSIIEDADYHGIKKSATYSGRKYRIVGSKTHQAWFLYLGKKKKATGQKGKAPKRKQKGKAPKRRRLGKR